MAAFYPRELMAMVLAREIQDGEICSPGGAASEIPLASVRLAQLTHAPNAVYLTSASGFVCNLVGKQPPPLTGSTTDWVAVYGGTEALIDWPFVMSTRRDLFFAGGLQVDVFGNVNLIGVGQYPRLKMRGPGTAGIAQASALSDRFYIYIQEHSPRTLVERVDHISAVGRCASDPERRRWALPGGGPRLLVTPKATLGFGDNGTLELKTRHPGTSCDELMEITPQAFWGPHIRDLPETPAPTEEELHVLRTQVDPNGVLRR